MMEGEKKTTEPKKYRRAAIETGDDESLKKEIEDLKAALEESGKALAMQRAISSVLQRRYQESINRCITMEAREVAENAPAG